MGETISYNNSDTVTHTPPNRTNPFGVISLNHQPVFWYTVKGMYPGFIVDKVYFTDSKGRAVIVREDNISFEITATEAPNPSDILDKLNVLESINGVTDEQVASEIAGMLRKNMEMAIEAITLDAILR